LNGTFENPFRRKVLPMCPEWTVTYVTGIRTTRIDRIAYLKCFFEKARPEPVLRYCSNAAAKWDFTSR
jgi:hypothetical protein